MDHVLSFISTILHFGLDKSLRSLKTAQNSQFQEKNDILFWYPHYTSEMDVFILDGTSPHSTLKPLKHKIDHSYHHCSLAA